MLVKNHVRKSRTTEIWCDDDGTTRHICLVEEDGTPLKVYLDAAPVTFKPAEDSFRAVGSAFADFLNPDARDVGWHTGSVRFHLDAAGQVDLIDEVKIVTGERPSPTVAEGDWTITSLQRVSEHAMVHTIETVDGVLFTATLHYDKDGTLLKKVLTRADTVRG